MNSKKWQFIFKKNALTDIAKQIDFTYEEAIKPREIEIEQRIAELRNDEQKLLADFGDLDSDEDDTYPTNDQIDIYNDQADIQHTIFILDGQMVSMKEMQIVYLYKNIEIILKEIIRTAFPGEEKRDLFAWDNMKSFFKLKQIEFTSIKEFEYVNQLRIVNNNIKHSSEIGSEIQKKGIKEFKDLYEFNFNSLTDFYNRVKIHIEPFLDKVAINVNSHLFEFSDERIDSIVKGYAQHMDERTLLRLSKALEAETHNKQG
ncbi:hypothetical protein CMT41_16715 [Colwellia sp. MT41]|nr:hypothetical protein CMT41_16715 [Colwellia sp. MT41]